MTVEPGARLAHYEIVSLLGKGGMGEVWRARDTKLGREVAIKVLPTEFTTDAERLLRFEREARLLASLHHASIASIFGIEESGGMRFLAMQLAAGTDLSERLKSGAIPVDEALPIARQIAEALDVAHERGVIHRDLKPANIKLDGEGHVTILDFGLAKALDGEEGDSEITNSPTMVRAATNAGVILGTAAYMSPEQARGKKVDRRADIWSFGVVLWEMLTGQRLFLGETVSDTLAAVLTRSADLDALPKETPPSIRRLIARCLERNPKRRLRDIGEAALAIEQAIAGDGQDQSPAATVAPPKKSRSLIAALAVAGIAVLALATVLLLKLGAKPSDRPDVALLTQLIPDGAMPIRQGPAVAISRDGRALVFVGLPPSAGSSSGANAETLSNPMAGGDGGQLWLRRLGDLAAVPLPGTDGARSPFFSPDGQWIAFFSPNGLLRKVALTGGSPLTLCPAITGRGGTWGKDNVIVFAPNFEGGLFKVSADGGEPQRVTAPDQAAGERSHRWPQFLPDGHSVLFMAQLRGHRYDESIIKIVDLVSGKVRQVERGGSYPRFLSNGNLAWVRGNSLLVAPFDLGKMKITGSPRPALENVMSSVESESSDDGTAYYDVSDSGVLVYRPGETSNSLRRLVLVDRSGRVVATSEAGNFSSADVSADGTRVATVFNRDIWIWEPVGDRLSRLTFSGAASAPTWSPDGRAVLFTVESSDRNTLTIRNADGTGEPRAVAEATYMLAASSWSRDGRTIIAHRFDKTFDLIAIPLLDGKGGAPVVMAGTPAMEFLGRLSPDGKWLAYQSNESGQFLVYVRAMTGSGRWQVSEGSGNNPYWTRGGKEIVYGAGTGGPFYGVDVDLSSGVPRFGRSHPLFEHPAAVNLAAEAGWGASTDHDRFAFVIPEQAAKVDASSVVIVTDWFSRLKTLASPK